MESTSIWPRSKSVCTQLQRGLPDESSKPLEERQLSFAPQPTCLLVLLHDMIASPLHSQLPAGLIPDCLDTGAPAATMGVRTHHPRLPSPLRREARCVETGLECCAASRNLVEDAEDKPSGVLQRSVSTPSVHALPPVTSFPPRRRSPLSRAHGVDFAAEVPHRTSSAHMSGAKVASVGRDLLAAAHSGAGLASQPIGPVSPIEAPKRKNRWKWLSTLFRRNKSRFIKRAGVKHAAGAGEGRVEPPPPPPQPRPLQPRDAAHPLPAPFGDRRLRNFSEGDVETTITWLPDQDRGAPSPSALWRVRDVEGECVSLPSTSPPAGARPSLKRFSSSRSRSWSLPLDAAAAEAFLDGPADEAGDNDGDNDNDNDAEGDLESLAARRGRWRRVDRPAHSSQIQWRSWLLRADVDMVDGPADVRVMACARALESHISAPANGQAEHLHRTTVATSSALHRQVLRRLAVQALKSEVTRLVRDRAASSTSTGGAGSGAGAGSCANH